MQAREHHTMNSKTSSMNVETLQILGVSLASHRHDVLRKIIPAMQYTYPDRVRKFEGMRVERRSFAQIGRAHFRVVQQLPGLAAHGNQA